MNSLLIATIGRQGVTNRMDVLDDALQSIRSISLISETQSLVMQYLSVCQSDYGRKQYILNLLYIIGAKKPKDK